MEYLGSFMYIIIASADNDILTSSFSSCIPLTYFRGLSALAKILSTILNRCGDSRQPCLVPQFSGIDIYIHMCYRTHVHAHIHMHIGRHTRSLALVVNQALSHKTSKQLKCKGIE